MRYIQEIKNVILLISCAKDKQKHWSFCSEVPVFEILGNFISIGETGMTLNAVLRLFGLSISLHS